MQISVQNSEPIQRKTCPCSGFDVSARTQPVLPATGGVARSHKAFRGSRQWVIWVGSLVVWLFIALAATLAVMQMYRTQGSHMAFSESAYMQLSQMMPYALLTPLVFALVACYPLRRKNWIWVLALYLIAGVAFSAVHVGLRGMTPYGVWDKKAQVWRSAMWDSQARKIHVQWPVYKTMFTNQWYDDVVNTYVPILFIAYVASYYSKLKAREQLTSQLEIQLAKANLQVLKSQLQPHFLFNTMHSISGLMFTDVRAADRMMTRLSELLRMSLEEGTQQTTTLNRELEFANGYLEIEKMRLGDRLSVDLNISPETLDAEVPHLLLQPLIENAVQYGVSKLASKGEIKITSRREGSTLWLTISDNGSGFDEPDAPNRKPGLGIGASRERLRTLYGENQSLRFQVPEGGGTQITIRIPFRPTIHTDPDEE